MQPITSIDGSSPITGLHAPYTHYLRPDMLQALSDKLGLSIPELQAKIQGSQGLVDIARSRGVSIQELANTVGIVSLPHPREPLTLHPVPPGWLTGFGQIIDVRV